MNRFTRKVDVFLRFVRENRYFALIAIVFAAVITLATFKDALISLADLVNLKRKASADVAVIEKIKKEVEHHRDAIQMIVRDANAVREEIVPISENVESLNEGISEAFRNLARLRGEQEQIAAVGHAEAFNRDAYHELEKIAQGTNQIAPLARATLSKVQRTLILDRGNLITLVPLERRGQDKFKGPFSTDELAVRLRQHPPDGAINVIGKEKYRLFVPELVTIAHTKDLWTANRAAKALDEIASVSFDPWNLEPLDAWWELNQAAFTNWPYEVYYDANAKFSACRYHEALNEFNKVLLVDPAADRSRALAVACALEIGDIETAQNLNVDYAQDGGRWQRWADSKMLLTTGKVDQATQVFATLAKDFPTFSDSAWIQRGNHVLRQLDWNLFDKEMSDQNNETSNNEIQPTK